MNITQLVTRTCRKLKYGSTVGWYNLWHIILHRRQKIIPQVASIDETIRKIIQDWCSVSHFGDGEMPLTNVHKRIGLQEGNPQLAQRLKEVLISDNDKHLVCISGVFQHLECYNWKARRFRRTHLFVYGPWWDQLLPPERTYYNIFIIRSYMDFKPKRGCGEWFHDMKGIWEGRDIIFIEDGENRLGVGNDLFDNAQSIHRILCPPCNAFNSVNRIRTEVCKQNKNVLFLITLGPTAIVLTYDLFKAGYQAIDIGHMDVEYGRWRMGARRKVKFERKYVNEALNGSQVTNAGEEYDRQTIAKTNQKNRKALFETLKVTKE